MREVFFSGVTTNPQWEVQKDSLFTSCIKKTDIRGFCLYLKISVMRPFKMTISLLRSLLFKHPYLLLKLSAVSSAYID